MIVGLTVLFGVANLQQSRSNRPASGRSPLASDTMTIPRIAQRYERYVHSHVNLRSGPGTTFEVVNQLRRHEPVWVGQADSTGWMPVYGSKVSNDTIGFVLSRLVHRDPLTAAEKEQAKASLRRAYAKRLESDYLDQGMDIRVTTRGANATTLRLEYVLFDRVWAHQFGKSGDHWSAMRELGFRRVEMNDGYSFATAWTLD